MIDCDNCIHNLVCNREQHLKERCIFFEEPRPHGEWISCSERLPEDERPVLIYAWNVHHVVARYGQFRTEDGGYKNAWVTAGAWFGNTEIKHKVIAWTPLPEPYKEEGDSDA